MLWRTPKDWGGLEGHDLAALGLPTEQEMVAYYCELAKRPLPDPALWEFYMAYNLFRVSCIRQGVYARALDGTASNMRAAESGKLVRPAADLAWQIVEQAARLGLADPRLDERAEVPLSHFCPSPLARSSVRRAVTPSHVMRSLRVQSRRRIGLLRCPATFVDSCPASNVFPDQPRRVLPSYRV